jgi:hypothetical protein
MVILSILEVSVRKGHESLVAFPLQGVPGKGEIGMPANVFEPYFTEVPFGNYPQAPCKNLVSNLPIPTSVTSCRWSWRDPVDSSFTGNKKGLFDGIIHSNNSTVHRKRQPFTGPR